MELRQRKVEIRAWKPRRVSVTPPTKLLQPVCVRFGGAKVSALLCSKSSSRILCALDLQKAKDRKKTRTLKPSSLSGPSGSSLHRIGKSLHQALLLYFKCTLAQYSVNRLV